MKGCWPNFLYESRAQYIIDEYTSNVFVLFGKKEGFPSWKLFYIYYICQSRIPFLDDIRDNSDIKPSRISRLFLSENWPDKWYTVSGRINCCISGIRPDILIQSLLWPIWYPVLPWRVYNIIIYNIWQGGNIFLTWEYSSAK